MSHENSDDSMASVEAFPSLSHKLISEGWSQVNGSFPTGSSLTKCSLQWAEKKTMTTLAQNSYKAAAQ